MKNLFGIVLVAGLSLVLLITGCGSAATLPPPSPSAAAPANPVKPSWQQDWDNTVSEARKEGRVNIVMRLAPEGRDSLAAAFKEKYGIEIEYIAGQAVETWPKVEAERRRGIYTQDVMFDGVTSLITTIQEGDAAQRMDTALVLPEVKDPKVWLGGVLPLRDGNMTFMFLGRVGPSLLINTDLVKPVDFKGWRSLLEPKWKGQILMYDASIPGAGNSIITTVASIMGKDFLRELAKQGPVLTRDRRLQVEWVARGKYPVCVGFDFATMEEVRSAGAPIAHVVPSEGTYFGTGTGAFSIFNKAAHPNAQKVFANWFLSKEGQTLFVNAAKEQSRRLDVIPVLAPDRLFQDGMKYVDSETEEFLKLKQEVLTLSKELFGS